MNKKIANITLILLVIIVVSGCTGINIDPVNQTSISSNLYVKVAAGSADIFLLNQDGQIVQYREDSSKAQFFNLENKTYQIKVGKIGYSLFTESVMVKEKTKVEVELEPRESAPVEAKIAVTDETGEEISGFKAVAYTQKEEIDSSKTSGEVATLEIWPGVICNYKVTDPAYLTYKKTNTVYLKESGSFSLQGSLVPGKQVFSADRSKQVNLGTLAKGETAVVGISLLDFDPTNNTSGFGCLDVNYSSPLTSSKLIKLESESDITSIRGIQSRQTASSTVGPTSAQQLLSQHMRQLGKKKISYQLMEPSSSLRLSSTTEDQLTVGAQKSFFVRDNLDGTSFSSVEATLRRKAPHLYLFVENNLSSPISEDTLDRIKEEFNDHIYPRDLNKFAVHKEYTQANLYDVDGNGRPIILLTNLQHLLEETESTVMGFFNPGDYLQQTHSNHADMIYINSRAVQKDGEDGNLTRTFSTLAHEFQHLIYFVEKNLAYSDAGKPEEHFADTWLNEGFSGLAEYLNGYYRYHRGDKIYDAEGKRGYFNDPSGESLLYWNGNLSDYGASYLFALYLYDQYGLELIHRINSTYQAPRQVIADFTGKSFASLFLDWALTNYITDWGVSDKYSYEISDRGVELELEVKPYKKVIKGTIECDFSVKPNGVKYYKIEGTGSQVELNIKNLNHKTGVIVYRE